MRAWAGSPSACTVSQDSFGGSVIDRAGDAHGAIYTTAQIGAKRAGNTAAAGMIGKAALPGALIFSAGSEYVGFAADRANGMSAGRAGSIHGMGFVGGVLTGAFIGELIEPFFGGIPGAILGGYFGGKCGESIGGTVATALTACH